MPDIQPLDSLFGSALGLLVAPPLLRLVFLDRREQLRQRNKQRSDSVLECFSIQVD